jgi:hypothetical protein
VQLIRLNPSVKESNESLRDSSVTVVCWHIDVVNLQWYILIMVLLGPICHESPPSTRFNCAHAGVLLPTPFRAVE